MPIGQKHSFYLAQATMLRMILNIYYSDFTAFKGVQLLTLLNTIPGRKLGVYPFRIPSIDKWYPFRHIPSLKLCIPLTAVESLSFKYG